MESLALTANS
jgi:hypothetical protein